MNSAIISCTGLTRHPASPTHLYFSQIGRQEYEADLFAAELLISDKDLLTALQNGHSIFEAATLLECTPATLDMKTECLRLKQKIR